MVESNSGRTTSFVKMTGTFIFQSFALLSISCNSGLNTQLVKWDDRRTEVYAFNKGLFLDARGKPISPANCPVFIRRLKVLQLL